MPHATEILAPARSAHHAGEGDDVHVGRRRQQVWAGTLLVLLPALALVPVLDLGLSAAFSVMVWIVLTSSLNIMAGYTGYMPFGFVAFYGIGAYATGIAHKSFGWPMPLALAACAAAGALLALLISPTLRLRGVYFGIVSLGLAVVVKLGISLLPEGVGGGALGLILARSNDPLAAYYALLAVLAACLAAATWIAWSDTGRALGAIRDDEEAAASCGVNVVRTRLVAWLLCAVFPSLAGGIEAWYTNAIDPEQAFSVLITAKTIVYAMAGGFGTLLGPVLGALLMLGIDQLIWRAFPLLNLALLGALIVLLVLALPRGLVGSWIKRYPHHRRWIP